MSRARPAPGAERRGGTEVGPRRHAELHHHRRSRRGAPPLVRKTVRSFREALTLLFSNKVTTTAVPTVVVVFPDDKTFDPFKPVYQGKKVEIGGLFVPRQDVNYILIGPDRGPDALRSVFHEYAHLVMSNVAPDLPVWLNEGLAEYTARSSLPTTAAHS